MWKIRKLDEQLFVGAAAKIREFLDIEPLMPPGRLRLSKLFGRAMIDDLQCDRVGWAFRNECRNVDCEISGTRNAPGYVRWAGHASRAPNLVNITIVSGEDREFGEAWFAKHNAPWPYTHYGIHPTIKRLESLIIPPEEYYDWEESGYLYSEYSEFHVAEDHCEICATKYIEVDVEDRDDE